MDWHTPRIQEPADVQQVFGRAELDEKARKTRWAQTTPAPPHGQDGTAYCYDHELIEPFTITGDCKQGLDERLLYDSQGARLVSVVMDCDRIQKIVTSAT